MSCFVTEKIFFFAFFFRFVSILLQIDCSLKANLIETKTNVIRT